MEPERVIVVPQNTLLKKLYVYIVTSFYRLLLLLSNLAWVVKLSMLFWIGHLCQYERRLKEQG